MVLLRRLLGDVLRRHRLHQSRTLRDVSSAAGVSLGYLSEVERGRKEASSELLEAICGALEVNLSEVLREVSDDLAREERRVRLAPVGFATNAVPVRNAVPVPGAPVTVRPVAGIPASHPARPIIRPEQRPVTPVASFGLSLAYVVAA